MGNRAWKKHNQEIMANCEESPREKHSFNNEEFRKLNKEEIERLRYFLVL